MQHLFIDINHLSQVHLTEDAHLSLKCTNLYMPPQLLLSLSFFPRRLGTQELVFFLTAHWLPTVLKMVPPFPSPSISLSNKHWLSPLFLPAPTLKQPRLPLATSLPKQHKYTPLWLKQNIILSLMVDHHLPTCSF